MITGDDINDYKIGFTYTNGMNVIGLVTIACIAGVAMSSMHGKVPTLLAFATETSALMMKITTWVIFVSPIGIFSLTVSQIIEMDDLHTIAQKLSLYLVTVIVGILVHGFIVLPIIFYAFTRQNPYLFIARMSQALVMAFGTASRYEINLFPFQFFHSYCSQPIPSSYLLFFFGIVRPHYPLRFNVWKRKIKSTPKYHDSCYPSEVSVSKKNTIGFSLD